MMGACVETQKHSGTRDSLNFGTPWCWGTGNAPPVLGLRGILADSCSKRYQGECL